MMLSQGVLFKYFKMQKKELNKSESQRACLFTACINGRYRYKAPTKENMSAKPKIFPCLTTLFSRFSSEGQHDFDSLKKRNNGVETQNLF